MWERCKARSLNSLIISWKTRISRVCVTLRSASIRASMQMTAPERATTRWPEEPNGKTGIQPHSIRSGWLIYRAQIRFKRIKSHPKVWWIRNPIQTKLVQKDFKALRGVHCLSTGGWCRHSKVHPVSSQSSLLVSPSSNSRLAKLVCWQIRWRSSRCTTLKLVTYRKNSANNIRKKSWRNMSQYLRMTSQKWQAYQGSSAVHKYRRNS